MKTKQILWIRFLSCGHQRATNIAFMSKIYTKPKVGDNAFCRECCQEVEIVKVRKASNSYVKNLKKLIKRFK